MKTKSVRKPTKENEGAARVPSISDTSSSAAGPLISYVVIAGPRATARQSDRDVYSRHSVELYTHDIERILESTHLFTLLKPRLAVGPFRDVGGSGTTPVSVEDERKFAMTLENLLGSCVHRQDVSIGFEGC